MNYTRDAHTDYWQTFMGHLMEPAFTVAFRENSAIDDRFHF